MELFIDTKNGVPIYDQIRSQLKARILRGELPEDSLLPSIRNLAKDLRISVITTKRAYDELEREGFIYTVAGKGSYVAPRNLELLREEQRKAVEEKLDAAIRLAEDCGMNADELRELLDFLLEECQNRMEGKVEI